MRKFNFNEHGVCEDPKIAWRGIYNNYGGKNTLHPLFGVSYVSVAYTKGSWVYGYSVGSQLWMSLGGCNSSNGKYPTEKEAVLAGLRRILALVKEQMAMRPPSDEKDRLRSLIADISEEIWKHKQLSLF